MTHKETPSPSLQDYPKPWVVADLCALRALGRGEELPGRCSIVIPDWLFLEASQADNPVETLEKVDSILSSPAARGRVIIGKNYRELDHSEATPQKVQLGGSAVANHALTQQTRLLQQRGQSVVNTKGRIPFVNDVDASKERVIAMKREFARISEDQHPDRHWKLIRSTPSERASDILAGLGDLHSTLIKKCPRFGSRAWSKHLKKHPTGCAAIRILLISQWHWLDSAAIGMTNTKRLGNDWDDAHYALLALYTRHVWTNDKGLGELLTHISRGAVRVHSSLDAIS